MVHLHMLRPDSLKRMGRRTLLVLQLPLRAYGKREGVRGILYPCYVARDLEQCISNTCFVPLSHFRRLQRELRMRPFVCIWDWRNSVLGMTLRSATDQAIPQQLVPHDVFSSAPTPSTLCSRLLFCSSFARIVHMRAGSSCVKKDLYEFGLLSPSSVVERAQGSVEEASPLMVSPDSVAFPLVMNVSFICIRTHLFMLGNSFDHHLLIRSLFSL